MPRILDDNDDARTVDVTPTDRFRPAPAVRLSPDGLTPEQVAEGKKLAEATMIRATTGKMPDGLTLDQKILVNDAASGLATAKRLGEEKNPIPYYNKVKTRGDWDFKNPDKERYAGVNQKARQYFGNWFFGASGAAWQHGAVGRLGAMASDWFGVGEDTLRRGAGAYQVYQDSKDLRHPWKLLNLKRLRDTVRSQDGSNLYGDNPGDGDEISEGYAAYNRAHNIRLPHF